MQRHGAVRRVVRHETQGLIYGHICRVALGTRRKVYGCLGKGYARLRHADLVDRIEARIRKEQRVRVRQTDILRG